MRQVRPAVIAALACALVWGALVLPDGLHELRVATLIRVPLEGLLLVALLLVLPVPARRPLAVVAGMALGLAVVLKVLDIGFSAVLDRRFHELDDWSYLGPAYDVLRVWAGPTLAVVGLVVLVLTVLGAVALLVPATLQVQRLVSRRPRATARVLAVLGAVWVLAALTGLRVGGTAVASAGTARLVAAHAQSAVEDYRAEETFARAMAEDRFASEDDLLAGLAGKDVLLVWVESYGRVALEHPEIAPGVTDVLDAGTRELADAGLAARTAYLTSPTFGGSSWLPHATLQSGVWTDDQARYEQLLATDRLTLTGAFGKAGWDTSVVLPAVQEDWPEGRDYYGFGTLLGARDLGYRGPELGWGGVPDQFTLAAVQRSVLDESDRPPVMAEVDLVTSHLPWPPPPPLVAWDEVGDGSVYACMPGCGRDPAEVDGMGHARERYGDSVRYVLRTVISFLVAHPDPDLVVVLVGDHQPWAYVTGPDPGHEVPVTIISGDPEVMSRVDGWGWTPGMRPAADAPVWRMDAFRDAFLAAFGAPSLTE